MDNFQKIVSSRGILRSCDIHNLEPRSSTTELDFGGVVHQAGGSIYCCTDALENFAEQMLDALTIPFVLVSGDADSVVSPEGLGSRVFERILNHPNLLRWYAQHLDFHDPRLHVLPAGLDYHTLWEHPEVWGEAQKTSPFVQERVLLDLKARSLPADRRKPLAYCNWHHSLDKPGRQDSPNRRIRQECLAQVDKSVCYYEPAFLPRFRAWEKQREFAFVLSPDGNGPDSHRTWESLVLGCVPIVKRNFMSDFLHDLPVIVVEDWREISAATLQQSLAALSREKFNFSKLYLEYWRKAIRGGAPEGFAPLSMAEFLEML